MSRMAEAILNSAEREFQAQFEDELRARLMVIATAEVEHTVHEVVSNMRTHWLMQHDVCSNVNHLQLTAKVIQ